MKPRRRSHESTAYHEAGHAVAAVVLRLKIGRHGVTIVPDKERDMLGYANITAQLRERPDCATSERTRARLEAWAVAHLAGDAAERKFGSERETVTPPDGMGVFDFEGIWIHSAG
jgi:ATP-dependent Zn protease